MIAHVLVQRIFTLLSPVEQGHLIEAGRLAGRILIQNYVLKTYRS